MHHFWWLILKVLGKKIRGTHEVMVRPSENDVE
jgi:hypothetical protein